MPASEPTSTRRGTILLVVAVAALFLPGALEFARRGVPDILYTGDGALLELRTLHALHGTQLLGAYSRFQWSHPGPLLFYLAAPLYTLSGLRGPALNLFIFIVSFFVAVGVVFTMRRLAGLTVGFATAALFGVYTLVAVPHLLSNNWNPIAPIVPFILLSVLAVRAALGANGLLPFYVFLASTIVQTHVAFAPEVAAISLVALIARLWLRRTEPSTDARRSTTIGLAAFVLLACWALPLYEEFTNTPGNLTRLVTFFTSKNPTEHSWRVAMAAVFTQMSVMPVAIARTLRVPIGSPSDAVSVVLGVAQIAALASILTAGIRSRRHPLIVLSTMVLVEIAVAMFSVRAIRGEIERYLLIWISALGFMTSLVFVMWLHPWLRTVAGRSWADNGLTACSVAVIGFALLEPVPRAPVFRGRDQGVEQLAAGVEHYIRRNHLDRPLVRIVDNNAWTDAVGTILQLQKHHVPVVVEDRWTFMVGDVYRAPPGERPTLIFGDRDFAAQSGSRRDLQLVASGERTFAYAEDVGYLQTHRIAFPGPPPIVTGTRRDPSVLIDGTSPPEGSVWDSALTMVLESASSTITLATPPGNAAVGMFLSVDGSDLYTIRCVDHPTLVWSIGVVRSVDGPPGMRTRSFFADDLATCRQVQISASGGDGAYSIGEIGFLRK